MFCGGSQSPTRRQIKWEVRNFKRYKQLKVPFAIYANFEGLTAKINSAQPNSENSFTEK